MEIFYFNWIYVEIEFIVFKMLLIFIDVNLYESDGKLLKKKEIEFVFI